MAYTKTNWVNDESPDIDADNLNKMEQGIYDAQFPDGGTVGQILARTANGRGWVDPPNSAVWGLIQGTLSDQTDLAMALEDTGKVDTVNGIQPDVYKDVQVDVELTQAEYNALPISKYTDDVNYWIKDGQPNPELNNINADGVIYDNTTSGLTAETVQDAVDENASEIVTLKNGLTSRIDIRSGASSTTGTVSEMSYVKSGSMYYLHASVSGMNITANTNYWVTVPSTFPGNADFFAPLSVSYTGVVAVYRTQGGSGKYILVQSPTSLSNVTLNFAGVTI